MPWIFLAFLLGLAIGSFLNVCIYRLPRGESLVSPASHCVSCNQKIAPWDLIPVVSYIVLRGRCRNCQTPFSPRMALVELLTGCLFILALFTVGLGPLLFKAEILIAFLVVITFIDFDCQLILDKVVVWLAGTGVVINSLLLWVDWTPYFPLTGSSFGGIGWMDLLLAALIGGGIMLFLAVISGGGLGGGDIKFVAALGLWFGWKLMLFVLFLSFVIGGVISLFLLVFRLKGRKDFIPFGPFIATAALIGVLYGQNMLTWYLDSFLR